MSFGLKKIVSSQEIVQGWFYFLNECIGRKKHLAARKKENNIGSLTKYDSNPRDLRKPAELFTKMDDRKNKQKDRKILKEISSKENRRSSGANPLFSLRESDKNSRKSVNKGRKSLKGQKTLFQENDEGMSSSGKAKKDGVKELKSSKKQTLSAKCADSVPKKPPRKGKFSKSLENPKEKGFLSHEQVAGYNKVKPTHKTKHSNRPSTSESSYNENINQKLQAKRKAYFSIDATKAEKFKTTAEDSNDNYVYKVPKQRNVAKNAQAIAKSDHRKYSSASIKQHRLDGNFSNNTSLQSFKKKGKVLTKSKQQQTTNVCQQATKHADNDQGTSKDLQSGTVSSFQHELISPANSDCPSSSIAQSSASIMESLGSVNLSHDKVHSDTKSPNFEQYDSSHHSSEGLIKVSSRFKKAKAEREQPGGSEIVSISSAQERATVLEEGYLYRTKSDNSLKKEKEYRSSRKGRLSLGAMVKDRIITTSSASTNKLKRKSINILDKIQSTKKRRNSLFLHFSSKNNCPPQSLENVDGPKICGNCTFSELSLKEVLKTEVGERAFRSFLEKEHSVENLDFWLTCEKYKQSIPERRMELSTEIFNLYLKSQSAKEVNVSGTLKQQTVEKLTNCRKDALDAAGADIFNLMENDSFRRFISLQCATCTCCQTS